MRVKSDLWRLIPLLLLTFALGARGLDMDTLWLDELLSMNTIGSAPALARSPADIVAYVAANNPWHAPLFFLMLRGWAALTGFEPESLRVSALLIGLLAVAVMYRLGRDLFTARVGVLAAALLATSAFFIHYLHEIRLYSLMALLTALLLWLYNRALQARRLTRGLWLALLLTAAALLYTHYFAGLLLLPLGVFHLVAVGKNRRWWALTIAFAAAGLLFLPWFSVLLSGLQLAVGDHGEMDRWLPPLDLLALFLLLFGNGLSFLPLTAAAALWARGRALAQMLFISAALLALFVLLNQVARVILLGRLRYMIGLWIPLTLLVALGIAQVERRFGRGAAGALLAVWIGAGLWTTLTDGFSPYISNAKNTFNADGMAEALLARALPGDIAVAYIPDGISLRDSRNIVNIYMGDQPQLTRILRTMPPGGDAEDHYTSPFEDASIEQPRLWLATMPGREQAGLPEFEAALAERAYALCSHPLDAPTLRLELYARAPICCAPGAVLARFGEAYQLRGAGVTVADDAVIIGTLWQTAPAAPPDTYSVSFQVFDANGEKVAQHDEGLVSLAYACKRVTLAPLPAGAYDVRASVYEWRSGERLPGILESSGAAGDLLTIATFTVESD